MDLNIVKIFFKIGKILALTPTNLHNYRATFWQKSYSVLMFLFFTGGSIAALEFSWQDYLEENPIELVLWILTDVTRYVHNLYIFISVMTFKRKFWFVLITNLKKSKFQISLSEMKFLYIIFGLTHFGFFFIMSSIIYVCFNIYSVYSFTRYFLVEFLQIFTQFFYLSFCLIIFKMIFLRYRHIKKILKTQKLLEVKIEQLRLKQTVDIFCEIFGGTILLNIIYNSSKSLIYLNLLLKTTQRWSSGSPIFILMKLSHIFIMALFWVSPTLY